MLLKKISTSTVIGDVKKIMASVQEGATLALMNCYGRADSHETGEANGKPWVAFVGSFEVVNLLDGEVSYAPKIFLQEPLQSMILAQINEGKSVEFAAEISAKAVAKSIVGYEYFVRPLTEVKPNDALSHLRLLATPKTLLASPVVDEGTPKKEKKYSTKNN
jgi:hypothetical protein